MLRGPRGEVGGPAHDGRGGRGGRDASLSPRGGPRPGSRQARRSGRASCLRSPRGGPRPDSQRARRQLWWTGASAVPKGRSTARRRVAVLAGADAADGADGADGAGGTPWRGGRPRSPAGRRLPRRPAWLAAWPWRVDCAGEAGREATARHRAPESSRARPWAQPVAPWVTAAEQASPARAGAGWPVRQRRTSRRSAARWVPPAMELGLGLRVCGRFRRRRGDRPPGGLRIGRAPAGSELAGRRRLPGRPFAAHRRAASPPAGRTPRSWRCAG